MLVLTLVAGSKHCSLAILQAKYFLQSLHNCSNLLQNFNQGKKKQNKTTSDKANKQQDNILPVIRLLDAYHH